MVRWHLKPAVKSRPKEHEPHMRHFNGPRLPHRPNPRVTRTWECRCGR